MSIAYRLGRAVRAVWNGPFHIGKLSRPVSVGDVLLKMLETMWRGAIGLIGVVVSVVAAYALWAEVLSPNLFPPLASRIVAKASYDRGKQLESPAAVVEVPALQSTPAVTGGSAVSRASTRGAYENFRCADDFPLMIEFHNRSAETVSKINFEVEAYLHGHSTNHASNNFFTADSILKPGFSHKSCWRIRVSHEYDPSTLTYVVRVIRAYSGREST
jgi:hypothetical protein